MGEILTATASRVPDKAAIICDGKSVTYRELNSRVNQFVRGFSKSGINRTSRVAVLSHNSIELVITYFALARIGCIGIPLNFRLTVEELSSIIESANVTAFIVSEEFETTLETLKPHLTKINPLIQISTKYTTPLAHPYHDQPDFEPAIKVSPEDESFIIYTSGTTGRPRGVVLTHANHFWNALNYTAAYRMVENDVELALTPLFHSSTLGRLFTYVYNGVTVVTSCCFEPLKALSLIEQYRVTSITQTPTMYSALLSVDKGSTYSTKFVKRIVSGASPLFPSLKDTLARHFPHAGIYNLYGLTEASPGVSILTPDDPPEKGSSVGKPMKHVAVKVVNEGGRELSPGMDGEIVCKGPNVMKGYYNDPEATRKVLKNGWLHTGDTGITDRDGYLYLTGRKKELIVRGGENIYPVEVEAVLHQHPLIREAAVIGVPDEYWGETVAALVVLEPGASLTEEEIINHCSTKLAHYKRPRTISYVRSLPKNAAGKVIKKGLLRLLTESSDCDRK